MRVGVYGNSACRGVRVVIGAGSGFLSSRCASGVGCGFVLVVVPQFGYYALLYMRFIVRADLIAIAVFGARGSDGCRRQLPVVRVGDYSDVLGFDVAGVEGARSGFSAHGSAGGGVYLRPTAPLVFVGGCGFGFGFRFFTGGKNER